MAGRFMKIKKIVIPFITLVIMTSQLAGCAATNSDEMLKSMNESSDVSIEYANSDPGLIEDQGSQELQEISHDELIAVFEENYEISKNIYNSDEEEIIRSELEMIKIVVKNMDKTLPSDYGAQYRAWRPSVTQQTQAAAPEETPTFTEVNETVYAAGTVNLRSGPSTEDDKAGSLNKNQSVTRIGIGTGDYSSWSKVKLSDGSEVYAASNYLTTTKPASQSSSKPSGGSTGSTSGGQQTQGGVIIEDDTTGLNIVNGSDLNKQMVEDAKDLATNTSNTYSGYGEVSIGYGGN